MFYERFRFSLAASGLNATIFLQTTCVVGVVLGGWLADRLVRPARARRLYLTCCGMCLSAPFAYLMFATDSVDWSTATASQLPAPTSQYYLTKELQWC